MTYPWFDCGTTTTKSVDSESEKSPLKVLRLSQIHTLRYFIHRLQSRHTRHRPTLLVDLSTNDGTLSIGLASTLLVGPSILLLLVWHGSRESRFVPAIWNAKEHSINRLLRSNQGPVSHLLATDFRVEHCCVRL